MRKRTRKSTDYDLSRQRPMTTDWPGLVACQAASAVGQVRPVRHRPCLESSFHILWVSRNGS